MTANGQPILVIGLFNKPADAEHRYLTATEQMAQLFEKNSIAVITTSASQGKLLRLIDTVYTIIKNRAQFSMAIAPLFGTRPSFIWQEIATRLLKLFHKKIILVVHGGSIPERMQKNAAPFLKALRRADIVVCPSPYMQHVLAQYHITTVLIENVLPLNEYLFYPRQHLSPRIIWMRSFEDTYNPLMAVRMAALLAKKYPDFAMVMAGRDDGMLSQTKALAAQLGVIEKISFPGFIQLSQKQEYARTYDIYICTNRIDNAPVSIIEFMAMGVPVVAVKTGGIPYLITDNVNGCLVMPDDEKAMAEKIDMLINNPELCKHICANAHTYSRNYDEALVLQKWSTVLQLNRP